jgi:AcrR family transcriptional regulator
MSTVARRRRPDGERSRRAILDEAARLATVEGLGGLSLSRLADAVGMSKSGLFAHFGSKEELQLATVDEASTRFAREVVQPALAKPEGAPRLRALCAGFIDYLERGVFAGGCFFGAASIEFDDRPGPVGDRVREAIAAWIGYLEEQAAAGGAGDPKLVAFELQALAQGANSAFRLFGDRETFARARRAIDTVIDRELQASRRAK